MPVKRCQNTGCSKVYQPGDAGFDADRCGTCGFPILDPWQDIWAGQPTPVPPRRIGPGATGPPAVTPLPVTTPPVMSVPPTLPVKAPFAVQVFAKRKQDANAHLVATHPLDALEITVGRRKPGQPLPDIDVTEFDEERYVSAPHLSLVLRGGNLQVIDLGSKNGTWLNRVQLAPQQPHPLKEGDELVLGLGVGLKIVSGEVKDAHPAP